MRTVEAKLADWNRLYNELAQAQARLAGPTKLPASERAELEAEVARLQRDCDSALDLVQSLLQRRAGRTVEQRTGAVGR